MRRKARLIHVFCAILGVFAASLRAAEADKAAEVFESLYGAKVKAVKATRDAGDDIELAARLLAAAKEAANQPGFLAVLCEKAADLAGGHPDGYETAVEATDFLAAQVPDRAAACAERVVRIRQNQFEKSRGDERLGAGEALLDALVPLVDAKEAAGEYFEAAAVCRRAQTVARAVKSDRGEEIEARQKQLAEVLRTVREIAGVETLIQRNPENTPAREKLVRLYLVDLDDPAEAAKHLEGVKDKSLRKYVPAAAKGVEAAPELACMELGEWYRGLGEVAAPGAQAAMYARAEAYYERFLTLHTPDDLQRTQATLALKEVQAALEKLGGPPPAKSARGRWIDLLPLVDPAKDAVKGNWKRQGSALAIISPTEDGRITMPVVPEGSYELQVKFVRTSSDRDVIVILPVGSARVVLALSHAHGRESGLKMINGKGPQDNKTAVRPGTLVNGREYALHVTVLPKGDQARIAVRLDGKPYIAWSGSQSALSLPSSWALPKSRCVGLGGWESTVVFRSARLKMLSGQARLLRPAEKATPATAGETVKPGRWVDLLALADPAKDAVKGDWKRQDSALAILSPTAAGCIAVPIAPQGSYELQVKFVRTSGDDLIAVFLPVGAARVTLVMSHGHGRRSGLTRINGKGVEDNQTAATPGTLVNGREYAVHVTVLPKGDQARIAVRLDGKPYINWRGPQSALSVHSDWDLREPGCLGLGAWQAPVVFRSVRLKMLSGQARLLRPAAG